MNEMPTSPSFCISVIDEDGSWLGSWSARMKGLGAKHLRYPAVQARLAMVAGSVMLYAAQSRSLRSGTFQHLRATPSSLQHPFPGALRLQDHAESTRKSGSKHLALSDPAFSRVPSVELFSAFCATEVSRPVGTAVLGPLLAKVPILKGAVVDMVRTRNGCNKPLLRLLDAVSGTRCHFNPSHMTLSHRQLTFASRRAQQEPLPAHEAAALGLTCGGIRVHVAGGGSVVAAQARTSNLTSAQYATVVRLRTRQSCRRLYNLP